MKKIFTTFTIALFSTFLSAQDPIKNFSFENWVTNANNKLVPADWGTYDEDLNANAVRKHTSGSEGSSAAYIGSYNDGTDVVGAELYLEDNLTNIPFSISFDYIVQNNNTSSINGLVIFIYFYDKDDNELKNYWWAVDGLKNNTNFKKGFLNFDKDSIANAKSYDIEVFYYNDGGKADEYAIVDNFKFSNTPGNVNVREIIVPTISLYPNPTKGIVNYSLEGNERPSSIIVTSVDGKQTIFEPNFTNSINISTLVSGIYTVSFLDEKNAVIGRNKIVLTK